VTKQINKRRWSLLLVTIVTFILLGSTGSVFAQNKTADKYPKPDFSAMEEYWDIVEYEYDFSGNVPYIYVIAKPKQKAVPIWWDMTWLDNKGVKIVKHTLFFGAGKVQQSKIGDPIRGESHAPFKREMAQVKSVMVKENPDGGDAKTSN